MNLLCKATGNLAMTLTSNVKPAVVAGDGSSLYLVDGLVNAQGPNYALAKRMQHWRAVVARQEYRCMVSSNIAPSTATASVVSNRLFAMAYGGMPFFKPMEVGVFCVFSVPVHSGHSCAVCRFCRCVVCVFYAGACRCTCSLPLVLSCLICGVGGPYTMSEKM